METLLRRLRVRLGRGAPCRSSATVLLQQRSFISTTGFIDLLKLTPTDCRSSVHVVFDPCDPRVSDRFLCWWGTRPVRRCSDVILCTWRLGLYKEVHPHLGSTPFGAWLFFLSALFRRQKVLMERLSGFCCGAEGKMVEPELLNRFQGRR